MTRSSRGVRVTAARRRSAPASFRSHPLYEKAKAKWESSGLKESHALDLKLRPLTGEEVAALGDNFHPVGSLLIPYFDFKGKTTDFFRIRYLDPLPGFAGLVEKPQRYAQRKGTLNEVYYPPLNVEWEDVIEDPNVPIYITEGELKAAAGCAAGLATLGLGGVDVWRSTKRMLPMLPSLKEINWKNRQVVIVFDSDAAHKPDVMRAQRVLAQELLAQGAAPSVASLPPGPEGQKQGLDDFLVREGPEALLGVVRDAPLFPEADALWGLNEEVLYVRDPGIVIVKDTGQRLEPNRFVSHAFANRHYVEITMKNGTPIAKKRPLARRWVEWEARAEVERVVYEPGKPRLHEGTWNVWPGWGCEPKKGDVSLWKWLLDHLFGREVEARAWFERWCAYPIQYPGTKLYTSSLLWGVQQGTGKSLLAYLLAAIYGRNAVEIDNEALRASFNDWAENRQFVIGDEITAGDARIDKDKLKQMVTRKDISINQKFMPVFRIRDCINYLFTSNSPDALFVEDQDRRYFIHEVTAGRGERAFYERCDAWLHGDGPSHLFHHLLNLDLKDFNPRESAPMTAAKKNMIVVGKSDVGMWCHQLKEDAAYVLRPLGEEIAAECDLYTPSQLLKAYDPNGIKRVTAPGMSRELVRSGFRQLNGGSPVRTKLGVLRIYAIRNADRWLRAPPKEVRDHFERFFEPGAGRY